jgi:HlyD family secretion protein
MARILKILVVFLVVAGLAAGGYALLQNRKSSDNGFEMIDVERGSITEKAVAVGQIEPRLKFAVKSKISGIVRRCAVEVGDRVKPGDALFEIVPDPTPSELVEAQRRVDAALAAHKRAEIDWQRSKELVAQGITAEEEADARREAFEQAEIELASARDNLELTNKGRIAGRGREMESIIRAPAAGIVLERLVDPGDPVVPLTSFQAGTELATIADMGDLIFKGTVDEIDVGKLARIAPQATEEEGARLFEVEIELDPAEEITLRAGYSATADLVIREKTDVLVIPERLVLFEDDGAKTFVEIPGKGPETPPEKVAITTGLSDGLNIEVVEGLAEGGQIVQRPPREIL